MSTAVMVSMSTMTAVPTNLKMSTIIIAPYGTAYRTAIARQYNFICGHAWHSATAGRLVDVQRHACRVQAAAHTARAKAPYEAHRVALPMQGG